MSDENVVTPEIADAMYSILVEECGVVEYERNQFIQDQVDRDDCPREWRMSTRLGFGAKLFRSYPDSLPRVGIYPEDRTPERDAMAEAAMRRIWQLWDERGITPDSGI